mmetsp:Transcript_16546/g.29506  ORF Transcript_16546/g.29506 Transcript_16546/m.29506 type:complete len:237 (-) Transcript_16546:385-1095(-)
MWRGWGGPGLAGLGGQRFWPRCPVAGQPRHRQRRRRRGGRGRGAGSYTPSIRRCRPARAAPLPPSRCRRPRAGGAPPLPARAAPPRPALPAAAQSGPPLPPLPHPPASQESGAARTPGRMTQRTPPEIAAHDSSVTTRASASPAPARSRPVPTPWQPATWAQPEAATCPALRSLQRWLTADGGAAVSSLRLRHLRRKGHCRARGPEGARAASTRSPAQPRAPPKDCARGGAPPPRR